MEMIEIIKDYRTELTQAEQEISRLRALAVRVRKIEWRLENDEWIGNINGNDTFAVHPSIGDDDGKFHIYSIIPEVYCKVEYTEFDVEDEAKLACQSALEAWVMQFVEPINVKE